MERPKIGSKGIGGTVLAYYDAAGNPVYRLPEPKPKPSGKRQARKPKSIPGTEGTVEGTPAKRGSREADNARIREAFREFLGDA